MGLGSLPLLQPDLSQAEKFFNKYVQVSLLDLKDKPFENWLKLKFTEAVVDFCKLPLMPGNEIFIYSLALVIAMKKARINFKFADDEFWAAYNNVLFVLGNVLTDKYAGDSGHHRINLHNLGSQFVK